MQYRCGFFSYYMAPLSELLILAVAVVTPKTSLNLSDNRLNLMWPIRRKLADQFYRRFFELTPDAQALFPGDMERQHLKLMDMIAAIVGALDKHECPVDH